MALIKNIQGETMPASNRGKTRARASLMAAGSLAAVSFAVAAAGGVALAPAVAHAANECGDPAANGSSADTFQCTDATTFAAITYPATSGNLTLQLQNDVTVTTGGIVITPSGSNNVAVNRIAGASTGLGDPQITSTSGAGISIIRAANNGNFTVNLTDDDLSDPAMSVTGTTAGIYLSNSGTGNQTLTTTDGTITATTGVGVRLGTIGTGNITFTNGSTVAGPAGAVLVAEGVNATLTNNGRLLGSVTFNNTGNVAFSNAGVWQASGVNFMGSGSSTLTNASTGVIAAEGDTTISGLESFFSNGTILLGANADFTGTNGAVGDRLAADRMFGVPGLAVAMLDFTAGGADQATCAAAVSADCLDFRGGTVTGQSALVLNAVPGGSSMADRIVLADVGGGTVLPAAFVLSADSPGYFQDVGGQEGIDTGTYAYAFKFDDDQFYLAASPGLAVVQLSHLSEAASFAWDMTTASWFERQADMRDEQGDSRGGLWLRAVNAYARNDTTRTAGDFAYNSSYRQGLGALVGGADLVGSINGQARWVAGLTAGYVDSTIDYREGAVSHDMKGYSLGAYASYLTDRAFVDAIFNYDRLDVGSNLFSDKGEGGSLGVQVEGGYRWPVADARAWIEPVAAMTWRSTDVDQITLADGTKVAFADTSRLRTALGVRVSGDAAIGGLTTKFSLTGRAWQTLSGEDDAITLASTSGSAGFAFEDDRDTLGDVSLDVGLFGIAERLSVNLGGRLRFMEDYHSGQASIGIRYSF